MAEKPSLDEIFARPSLDAIFNPPQPTLIDKVKKGAAKAIDTVTDEVRTVGELIGSPIKMVGTGLGALAVGADTLVRGGNIDEALSNASQSIQDYNEQNNYQPQTGVGKAIHKVASAPFIALEEASQADIERRQEARGQNPLDVARGIANSLIPFAITNVPKGKITEPTMPENVRLARSVEGAVPVGEGRLVTPERPSRFNQEPVLNDMPQQPKMLPEPERIVQRRADVEAAVAADNELIANAIADRREQPQLFETPEVPKPEYQPVDQRVGAWEEGGQDLANQIADARLGESGFNHENLSGPTVVTARDSMLVEPTVKPVVKGTVAEVQEMVASKELNPKQHEIYYPEGKTNSESPAFIIRKEGTKGTPSSKVKSDLKAGGSTEAKWLGYPDRTGVPASERVTAAVTKQGEVLTDPVQIVEASTNKDVQWAAEGIPEEVIAKAQEVANAGKDIPLEEKTSPTSNLEAVEPKIETTEPIGTTLSIEPYGKRFAVRLGEGDSSVLLGAEFKTRKAAQKFVDEQRAKNENIKDLHAGIHPKEIARAIKATTDFISDWIPPTFKDRFQNFLSLPQRIAASGKYPNYTELYKRYRDWDEGRNSIAAKLFESVDAKNLRKQQNSMSRAERSDLAQTLIIGEQDRRFFTREELLNGQNPLGRPVSPRVADVYQGIRDLYHNTLQEDFKQQVETALHPYKDEPWFASLKELVDNDVPVSVLKAEIERSGKLVDKRLVDALREINEVKRVIEEEIIPHYSMNPEYVNHVRPEGDYRVSVYELNPDGSRGKEIYMRTAKSAGAAKQLIAKLRKDPTNVEFGFPQNYKRLLAENGEAVEGMQYEIESPQRMGNVNEEVYKYSGSMSAKEIELNNAITDAVSKGKITGVDANKVKDAIIDVLHKRQLSRGFGRHKLARQGQLIEGFDMSDPVGLALGYARTMAGFHTKARYAIDAAKQFKKAPKEEHYLMNEFIQDTLTNQNSNLVKAGALVRQNLVLTQLAYRAVAPLLNYTQNYVWAAPELASVFEKSGVVGKNALVEIKKAQGNILKNSLDELRGNGKQSLEPIVKRALDEFDRTGAAEAQNVREVAGLGQGAHVRYLTAATELGMKPFSYIERAMNREANFVAAFKNLMESGKTYEQAFEIAKDFSLNVNIDASAHNYPGLVRKTGEAGKTLYTFGRYGHSYLSWLFQKAIIHQEYKPVVRSMVVLGALGGAAGLPFVNEMSKFLERFLGVSPKLALRKAIKEKTEQYGIEEANAFVEDLVVNGIPAAVFNVNISRSVAPSLPIISEVIASGDVGKGLTGAVGGMAARTGRMFDAYGKGDTLRAVENIPVLPIGAANLVNAYRQSTEGVTTTSGKPVIGTDGNPIKMSGGEAAVKGLLGSNPQRIAREQDIRDSMFTMKEKYQSRLDKIKQKAKRKGWSPELRQEFKGLKDEAAYYKVPIKFSQRISRPRRDRRYTQSIKTYNYITEGDD